jgi:hypothetical protein
MAVAPAGGFESRPEVASDAALARLAMIHKEAIHATEPVIMEKMDHGNL